MINYIVEYQVDGSKQSTILTAQNAEKVREMIQNIYKGENVTITSIKTELPMDTPWGYAQNVTHVAEGIDFYSTAGHGGYKLSPARLKQMPEPFRNTGGWYEEDCEWAKVAVVFHVEFMESLSEERRIQCAKEAKEMIIRYYPDEYEQVYGIELKPGESQTRDEQVFYNEHKNDYVVVSARSDDDDPNNVILTAIRGKRNLVLVDGKYENEDEAEFIMPKEDYRKAREGSKLPVLIPDTAIRI